MSSAAASALAASVLPTPASPSSSSGWGSRTAQNSAVARPVVGEVVGAVEPRAQRVDVGDERGDVGRHAVTMRGRRAGSAAKARRQPVPQNQ